MGYTVPCIDLNKSFISLASDCSWNGSAYRTQLLKLTTDVVGKMQCSKESSSNQVCQHQCVLMHAVRTIARNRNVEVCTGHLYTVNLLLGF